MSVNLCKEIGCNRCCRDIDIDLTAEELEWMRKKGAVLRERQEWNIFSSQILQYHLVGLCPMNRRGNCAEYSSSRRPKECGNFLLNGWKCQTLRVEE